MPLLLQAEIGLSHFLLTAAVLQAVVAILNLRLAHWMKWKDELSRLSPLLREVFNVHSWFISLTLIIFAILTWRFSSEMSAGTNRLSAWLAGAIGVFWAVRSVIQWAYYSPGHWRGNARRTLIHIVLMVSYGGLMSVYLLAAFR